MTPIKTLAIAAAASLVGLGAANAATFTQSATYDATGATLVFDFADAALLNGPVTLTLASGDPAIDTGSDFPGFDLDSVGEFFELQLDGVSQGTFNCTGAGGVTQIDGADTSGPFGTSDCVFSLTLDVAADLLSDAALTVSVLFSDEVDDFGEADTLFATLVTGDAIPVPAAAFLFAPALAGLGFARRKRA